MLSSEIEDLEDKLEKLEYKKSDKRKEMRTEIRGLIEKYNHYLEPTISYNNLFTVKFIIK